MSAATRRLASLIAGLALTLTPGVVMACAALLCAPSWHHAAITPTAATLPDRQATTGHQHARPAMAEATASATHHDHSGHGMPDAGRGASDAVPGAPRIVEVPRDCCASAPQWGEPAIVSPRVDLVSHIDALFVVRPILPAHDDTASASTSDSTRHAPHPPLTSRRVLRI